ncbi:MAG TPA: CHAT domain-containing protein [Gemmatimonadaceae bacterium]|nr:CHAT domain-containing protein [Gemmatimonadaceae bacterium]
MASKRGSVRTFLRRNLRTCVYAALALSLLGVTLVALQQIRTVSPIDELAQSAAEMGHRPFRSRLSGPFQYAPLETKRGRGEDDGKSLAWLELRVAAGKHVASLDPHIAGISLLLAGDVDAAVERLQRATRSESPVSWSDLSAALIEQTERHGTIVSLIDALAAADQALRLDRRHAPAAFNRAVALEELGLLSEALAAWIDYEMLDPASSWAAEGRAAAARLDTETTRISTWRKVLPQLEQAVQRNDTAETRRVVKSHARDARAWGEAVYTANWAEAFKSGDRERATRELGYAGAIGDALLSETGEKLLADSVRIIDGSSQERQTLLADGYLAYRAGRMEYSKRALTTVSRLRTAEALFSRAHSPMAALTRYYIGSALYSEQRLHESLAILDKLDRERWEGRGYFALAAQIGWERGLATLAQGSFSAASAIFIESSELFEQIGDHENAAMLRNFQATTFELAGDVEQAWRIRRRVLEDLSRLGDAPRKIVTLNDAATAFISRREWNRARPILDLSIAAAVRENDDPKVSSGLAQRSAVLAAVGDGSGARRDLDALQIRLSRLTEPAVRAGLLVDADYAEALLVRDRDPGAAIRYLTRAIRELEHAGRALFLSRIYLERSRAYRRRGDRDSARADILAGLDWAERNRTTVGDPQLRAMALLSGEELFHDGILLALETGNREEAFDFAERARARSLLESFRREDAVSPIVPMGAAEIQRSLHPGAAIIEYVAVRDRLIAFVLTSKDVQTIDVEIPGHQLRELVVAASLSVRDRRGRAALERAFTLMIEPILELLGGVDRIAIVPDRAMSGVPFVALFNPRLQRFLIDDYTLSIAPSASLAILCSRRAAHAVRMPALSIAATDFDQSRFPKLERLPWVASEARSVADFYPQSRLLAGTDATPRTVTEALPRAGIVHFGGHSFSDPFAPIESALVLSPDPDRSDSLLEARDISRLSMAGTRLVVLSSCRSAIAGEVGDGIESLASAFMVAGVPSVLGTMWDVNDRASAEFSIAFHRHYRIHGDAARAFRDVALEQSRSDEVPEWAVVTPFGGFSGLIQEGEGK